jgi:hypothetical protein
VFVYVRFTVFVYRQRPSDGLITRPRSPTNCLRFGKNPKWNGEFHGGRPRPTGAVVPMEKKERRPINPIVKSIISHAYLPTRDNICMLHWIHIPTVMVEWAAILFGIQYVPGSNLGLDSSDCPDSSF